VIAIAGQAGFGDVEIDQLKITDELRLSVIQLAARQRLAPLPWAQLPCAQRYRRAASPKR
jgi:hypothetical protein